MNSKYSRKNYFVVGVFLAVLGLVGIANAADPNFISHWKFDEGSGSTMYDSAGDNDGTIYGASWTTGQINGALDFDGSNDYVEVIDPADGSLDFGAGNFSIILWFKTTDTDGELVDKSGGNKGRSIGYSLLIGAINNVNDGQICWRLADGTNGDLIKTNNTYNDGEWHHLAAVRTGSGSANLDIYVDGVDVSTISILNNGALNTSNPYDLSIGAKYDACDTDIWENFLDGKIDDVRIYNRALSAGEIQQLFAEGHGGRAFEPNPRDGETGVILDVVLSWSPGVHVASHDVYFGTGYNDVNDATTASAEYMGRQGPNSWDPYGLELGTTYYWRIDEINDPNLWKGDVWSFRTSSNEPIGWWKFDEGSGTIAYDSAGSNDGNIHGAQWTTGRIYSALNFDGVDDYVEVANSDTLDSFNEITLSSWIYLHSKALHNVIVAKATTFSNGYYFLVEKASAGGKLVVNVVEGWDYLSGPVVDTGKWYHVAYTFNAEAERLYVNGVKVCDRIPPVSSIKPSGSNLRIGKSTTTYWGNSYFNGIIDDVRIYDRALSVNEIWQLYHGVPGDLVDLEIMGLEEVRENCQAQQYTAIASYDSGYTRYVTNLAEWWVEPNSIANIDANGLLTLGDIHVAEDIIIHAEYTENGTIVDAEMIIQVISPQMLFVPIDFNNIQEAIDVSICGDAVVVAPGTYTGPGNRDIDFLGKAITVRSTDPNDPNVVATTVIDCNGTNSNRHRGFYFHSGEDANTVLSGFKIINGYEYFGGAIFCKDSRPKIINCIITENSVNGWGGGIRCTRSSPIIRNCTISNNDATITGYGAVFGGGISCYYGSNPEISNCTISNNSTSSQYNDAGGGIHCEHHSNPTITKCTIKGNRAHTNGGGIAWEHSKPTIINCIIIDNTAREGGGGIVCTWGEPTITNCVITGNSAGKYSGGAFLCWRSSPIISNCTIIGNKTRGNGGGIFCKYNSHPIINNCILLDNTAVQGHEIHLGTLLHGSGASTVSVSYSDIQGGEAEVHVSPGNTLNWYQGNIDIDPCFVEPGYWDANGLWVEGDYRLLENSPCIDTGDPNYVPEPNETDLDGNSRVVDGNNDGNSVVDIGAYEYQPPTPAELIVELLEEVAGLDLPGGIENSLMAKLDAAIGALEDENDNNDIAAINTLGAFINAVEAQHGKKIPEAEADTLIDAAQEIIELLSDG